MPNIATITSAANPLFKDVRKAIARGGLTEDGCWIAESIHLVGEALSSGCDVRAIMASESALSRAVASLPRGSSVTLIEVPDALFGKVSATETSQGILALVKPREWTEAELFTRHPLVIVLDALQDPGNAGAVIRAAEAFGATGALFVKGTASPFHPKTLRAAAGSLFRLPFLWGLDAAAARDLLLARSISLFAALPAREDVPPAASVDLTSDCALIIGSEAHGVSSELRSVAREITIPTTGVESLNAAVAAGILLYEIRRQRGHQP